MSYKLGMILSLFFVVAFFLLGGDMIALSNAYASLDSVSISVGYLIAKSGRVDNAYLTSLENDYCFKFLTISPNNPVHGDVVDFVISREFDPLILSNTVITIKASRTTVIGYYG